MLSEYSSLRKKELAKSIAYVMLLGVALFVTTHMVWTHPAMQEYGQYLPYVQALLIFVVGYPAISSASGVVYYGVRQVTDHSTAAATRTITKIAGIAVLVSTLTSIFGINPSSALTVGSFSGLVVGLATQNVLSHAVAGIFIAMSRPFKHADLVTIAGQTGVVEEITIMYTKLSSSDGQEILIPSGKIIGEIITRSTKGVEKAPEV